MKRHPVIAFYILAFVISWLGWLPQMLYARGLFLFDSPLFNILGGVGPALAAVAVLLAGGDRAGVRALFGAIVQWRASWVWYAIAFGFWPLVMILALGMGSLLGRPFPPLDQTSWAAILPLFVAMLISNVWEEIGWRGFALSRLQASHPDLTVVLIMGVLWFLWHLPLLLNPASSMADLPWIGDLLFTISLTVLYTWLYRNTGGSLFFVTVFHAMSNTVAFVLMEADAFISSYAFVVVLSTAAALAIVMVYGPQRFTRSGRPA